MDNHNRRKVLTHSTIFLGLILLCASVLSSSAWAQPKLDNLKMVRLLENQDLLITFDEAPRLDEGVAFPPGANIVVKLDPPPRADRRAEAADVGLLRRGESAKAEISATIEIPDPINTAFDVEKKGNAFLLFISDSNTQEMIAIRDRQGVPAPDTITRFDLKAAELENLQGMALDPQRNRLYLLNVRQDGPELVDINIGGARSLPPSSLRNAKRRDLREIVGQHSRPRCIAFNPQNRHLYLFNPDVEEIIELTTNGRLVARREVLDLDFTDLKGCIFAPTTDRTDKPSLFNLFIATGGTESGEVTEWSLN